MAYMFLSKGWSPRDFESIKTHEELIFYKAMMSIEIDSQKSKEQTDLNETLESYLV